MLDSWVVDIRMVYTHHIPCPVMYLSPADNPAGAVWSRSRDINRMVLISDIGFPSLPPNR